MKPEAAREHDRETQFQAINEALADPLLTDDQREILLGRLDELDYDGGVEMLDRERDHGREE